MKTGKKPAVYDPHTLQFHNYAAEEGIAVPPAVKIASGIQWGMLGNDEAGDCVWAGAGHEVEFWNHVAGRKVEITTADALGDYSAVTGYDPSNPRSDQGTDVPTAYKYRRATGTLDSTGARHKLGAFAAIENGNVAHIRQAIWQLGAVGLGIRFPNSAMDQFNAGKPWTVVPGTPSPIEGHYIPAFGYDRNWLYIVTWAKVKRMSWGFYHTYADETYALLSPEILNNGKSSLGFDLAQLQADLAAVTN